MDNYASSNSELIAQLQLLKHPEGGYFVETDRQTSEIPSPFAEHSPRSLSTAIYYLLTFDDPDGVFHMNKSVTYHVLHQGRTEYTLIIPGSPPTIETKIMGTNDGELRQLLVGTGIWKRSRILPEDRALAKTPTDQDKIGCLITEVVVPGFHWEDHEFLTKEKLDFLFKGVPGGEEKIKRFEPFVRKSCA